jgi:hypothetical protein
MRGGGYVSLLRANGTIFGTEQGRCHDVDDERK